MPTRTATIANPVTRQMLHDLIGATVLEHIPDTIFNVTMRNRSDSFVDVSASGIPFDTEDARSFGGERLDAAGSGAYDTAFYTELDTRTTTLAGDVEGPAPEFASGSEPENELSPEANLGSVDIKFDF